MRVRIKEIYYCTVCFCTRPFATNLILVSLVVGGQDDSNGDDDDDDDEASESPGQTCSTRYPSILGSGLDFCQRAGASFCCEFDDNAAASACLENAATIAYWDCFMADLGCSVGDMPCYGGDDTLAPTPSPAGSPTAAPTLAIQFITASPTVSLTPPPTMTMPSSTPAPSAGSRGVELTVAPTINAVPPSTGPNPSVSAPTSDGGDDLNGAVGLWGSGRPAASIVVSAVLGILVSAAGM